MDLTLKKMMTMRLTLTCENKVRKGNSADKNLESGKGQPKDLRVLLAKQSDMSPTIFWHDVCMSALSKVPIK